MFNLVSHRLECVQPVACCFTIRYGSGLSQGLGGCGEFSLEIVCEEGKERKRKSGGGGDAEKQWEASLPHFLSGDGRGFTPTQRLPPRPRDLNTTRGKESVCTSLKPICQHSINTHRGGGREREKGGRRQPHHTGQRQKYWMAAFLSSYEAH